MIRTGARRDLPALLLGLAKRTNINGVLIR